MHEVIFDGTVEQFDEVFGLVGRGHEVVISQPDGRAAAVVPLAEYQALLDIVRRAEAIRRPASGR